MNLLFVVFKTADRNVNISKQNMLEANLFRSRSLLGFCLFAFFYLVTVHCKKVARIINVQNTEMFVFE